MPAVFPFLLSSPRFSCCSFEHHHSFPFWVFPFPPNSLYIILPSQPLLPPGIWSCSYSCPPSSPSPLPSVGVVRMLQNGNSFLGGFLKKKNVSPHTPSSFFFFVFFSTLVCPSVSPRPGRAMNYLVLWGVKRFTPSSVRTAHKSAS